MPPKSAPNKAPAKGNKPAPKAAAKAPAKAPPKPAAKAGAKAAAPAPAAKAAPKAAQSQRPVANGNGVYVKNWGNGSVADAVKIFSEAGHIQSARIRRNRYALIFFDSAAAVKKAIDKFNDVDILGHTVNVIPAKTGPKPDPRADSSSVFVGPIFRAFTTKKQIRELFSDVKVLRLRTYRQNYAYVFLDSHQTAEKVVKEKNGIEFKGHKLRVVLSTRSLEKAHKRQQHSNLLMNAHKFKKQDKH